MTNEPELTVSGLAYVVLGATGGTGRALCRRLARRGARLVLGARDEGRLDDLGDELESPHLALDAAEPGDVRRAVELCRETHGRIDGLVNAAGSILLRPTHRTSAEDFDDVVRQNLRTAFAAVHAGADALQRSGGSIVLFSSAAAGTGIPNHGAIAAAKAGVEGLMRSAAATYARFGVRVNCVAPGLVDTRMAQPFTRSEKALETSKAMHPLGRIGAPEEVARAAEWLLDPAQSWVTGQALGVDGGLATVRTH